MFFSNNKTLLWGLYRRLAPVRKKVQLETTRFRTRFRRVLVPVKIHAEAPEDSVRFRTFPVQITCDVPEGSRADTL